MNVKLNAHVLAAAISTAFSVSAMANPPAAPQADATAIAGSSSSAIAGANAGASAYNKNSNTNIGVNKQYQGQVQGQSQKAYGGTSLSNATGGKGGSANATGGQGGFGAGGQGGFGGTAAAVSSSGGNTQTSSPSQSMTYNEAADPAQQTVTSNGRVQVENVPNVYAPPVLTSYSCSGGFSVGGSMVGGGAALGFSYGVEECERQIASLNAPTPADRTAVWCTGKYASSAPSCVALKQAAEASNGTTTGTVPAKTSLLDNNGVKAATAEGMIVKAPGYVW